jgi:shikimate dehydrogenase
LRVEADGSLYGDNTDGVGLTVDIRDNLGVDFGGRRVLLLGAGGAARGVLLPLLQQRPAALYVINRTAIKARELVRRFESFAQQTGCVLQALPEDEPLDGCDVIINATAGSLDGTIPVFDQAAFAPGCLAYDMMYAAQPTIFMRHASAHGARVADGLGMLVEQAAESFQVWRNVKPNAAPVLAALRAILSKAQPPSQPKPD